MRDGRGRFQRGHDPARHQFTTEERQRGFARAYEAFSGTEKGYSWLLYRVKGFYWLKRRPIESDLTKESPCT
jgi:hypothetical protein